MRFEWKCLKIEDIIVSAIERSAADVPEGEAWILKIELKQKEFRHLLDLVYIGNWILNSTRGSDRIKEYDKIESIVFSKCAESGMAALFELQNGEAVPSRAFAQGGIHEAIMDYEDTVFFEILAEELARRDMEDEAVDLSNIDELNHRIEEYIAEFEENGTENIKIEG